MNKVLATILYIVSLIIICIYTIIELQSNLHREMITRVLYICMFVFTSYLATYFLTKTIKNKIRIINIIINIYFAIYICILIYLTVFSRKILYFNKLNIEAYIYYIKYKLNLIPFNSIVELFTFYFVDKKIELSLLIFNIIGNIIAMMPLAFFLPYKYKSMNKFKNFFIVTLIIICAIEIIQFITFKGICDIDDLILNISGACLMYWILQKSVISRFISKITYQNIQKIKK